MPKKPETPPEAEAAPEIPAEALEPLVPFFFSSINNGTTILARNQQEADEKAARLLLDIASQAELTK